MGHKPEQLEDWMLTQLDQAPLNNYCKIFERYDGQFDVDDIAKIKSRLPAVFVSWLGDGFNEVTPLSRYQVKPTLSVVVAAKSLRGKFEASTKTDGAYQMVEDVKAILHLNNLGQSDIVGLVLTRRVPLIRRDDMAVYGLDFTCEYID